MQSHTQTLMAPAAFARRDQAEAVIRDLRAIGFTDEELGVAAPETLIHESADDVGFEEVRGVGAGFLIGVPAGALVGIGIGALIVGGFGPLGLAGILASAGSGALWGLFFGGFAGLLLKIRQEEEEEEQPAFPLREHDILLVVRAGDRLERVHDIVLRDGGRCFCAIDRAQRAAA